MAAAAGAGPLRCPLWGVCGGRGRQPLCLRAGRGRCRRSPQGCLAGAQLPSRPPYRLSPPSAAVMALSVPSSGWRAALVGGSGPGAVCSLLDSAPRGLACSLVPAGPLAGVGCSVMMSTKEGGCGLLDTACLVGRVVSVFVFEFWPVSRCEPPAEDILDS